MTRAVDPFLGEAFEPAPEPPAPKVYPPQQMTWCAAVGTMDVCGSCGKKFAQGEAKAIVTKFKLERCETCALTMGPNVVVDRAAVDAHRAQILARQAELDAAKQQTPPSIEELNRRIHAERRRATAPGFTRLRELGGRAPFDHAKAAANDHD